MNTVSVVIPCRNAAGTIGACLEAIGRQTVKPLDVIVVDGASEDGSREVAARFPVKVVASAMPLSAGEARNVGKARAQGDIIAFTDADAIPYDDWLEKIQQVFTRNPDAAGVGGAILDGSNGISGRLEYLSNFSEFIPSARPGPVSTIPTLNVAYRREAIRGIDFIPTTAGEDTTFNAEIAARGGTLIFDPAIIVTHAPARRGLVSFFRNQYRCGLAFVYARTRFTLRGSVLLRHPVLLFFMPRLLVLFRRYLFTRRFVQFIVLLPLIAVGEICRTAGILKGRSCVGYGKK
ncbi:MAG: glycosyltransferase [Candidatus Aureabacteria bacterium]|nr:glycosyltransferase [Candidatus Auribacterota bacterium]